jgi:hypothetical protein
MLLHRSLPPPADLPVTINRRGTSLPVFGVDVISSGPPKPPNPLNLTLFLSGRYTRNDIRQTRWSYPACFQELIAKKGPFSAKSEWYRRLSCPVTGVRGVTVGLAAIDVRRAGAGPTETCTRTKLEGGLKSAAYQAESEGALSQLVQEFGSVTVLHVTVPLSNARLGPRTAVRRAVPGSSVAQSHYERIQIPVPAWRPRPGNAFSALAALQQSWR